MDFITFLLQNKLQSQFPILLQHCILSFYFIPSLALNQKGKVKSAPVLKNILVALLESDVLIKDILELRGQIIEKSKPNLYKK